MDSKISIKVAGKNVGLLIIHSYGAVMEIFLFLKPQQVILFQELNRFMYRFGVSCCQKTVNFSRYVFTFGEKRKWSRVMFMASGEKSRHCSSLENNAFDFDQSQTVQIDNYSIIGVCKWMNTFKVSAIQSNDPIVHQLQPLPHFNKHFGSFSIANYHNKLVIVTGGLSMRP